MIPLLFVADGELDRATIPALVENLLRTSVRAAFLPWPRLHGGGKGYSRKLLFALRQARDIGALGLVATADADRDREGERRRALAIGVAIPHAEAWLLDDEKAVRDGLGLPGEHPVPNVPSPKEALIELHRASPQAGVPRGVAWRAIAERIVPARCAHAAQTGFQDWTKELREEVAPLVLR